MKITADKLRDMIKEAVKGTALHSTADYPQEVKDAEFAAMDAAEECGLRIRDTHRNMVRGKTASVSKSQGAKNYLVTVTVYDPSKFGPEQSASLLASLKKICPATKKVTPYENSLEFIMAFPKSADKLVAPAEFKIPSISGIEDVSTERQRANGTTVILDKETGDKYSLHSNGYVRKIRISGSPYKAGQEEGTVMMKPGGGTPDQMVALVISAIQKSRKKAFGESVKRVVAEAIKGQPLHALYKPSEAARVVCDTVKGALDSWGFSQSTGSLDPGGFFLYQHGTPNSETIRVILYKDAIEEVSSVQEVVASIKNEVKRVSPELKTTVTSKSEDSRRSTVAITISVERSSADKQQPIAFDVPKIDGVEDISTEKQFFNGTVALFDKETEITYTLTSSGYVRKQPKNATLSTNLMLPGGGTPEEMVTRVVKAIERDRKKRLTSPGVSAPRDYRDLSNESIVRGAVRSALRGVIKRVTGQDVRASQSKSWELSRRP